MTTDTYDEINKLIDEREFDRAVALIHMHAQMQLRARRGAIAQAAQRLGISSEALQNRLQRPSASTRFSTVADAANLAGMQIYIVKCETFDKGK